MAPGVNACNDGADLRLATDCERAAQLLAEAGYGAGFPLTLRCPNDRYINDEAICAATIAMLRQVRIEAILDAVPLSIFWDELHAGAFDMYLLGWSPGTFDAEHPICFRLHTPEAARRLGSWSFGGFSNARPDALLAQIKRELDPIARQAMVDEATRILQTDVAHVPLHVRPLVRAVLEPFQAIQRPDNL